MPFETNLPWLTSQKFPQPHLEFFSLTRTESARYPFHAFHNFQVSAHERHKSKFNVHLLANSKFFRWVDAFEFFRKKCDAPLTIFAATEVCPMALKYVEMLIFKSTKTDSCLCFLCFCEGHFEKKNKVICKARGNAWLAGVNNNFTCEIQE